MQFIFTFKVFYFYKGYKKVNFFIFSNFEIITKTAHVYKFKKNNEKFGLPGQNTLI